MNSIKNALMNFMLMIFTLMVFASGMLAISSVKAAPGDPIPNPPGYHGKITEFGKDAEPWWPAEVNAPENAPNILIWLIDDAGYASVSAFGGLIDTPNIDRVAKMGLLYTNFHATPICSSSRTALLTGRNPHAAGMGGHAGGPAGFPGYYGKVHASAGSLAKILRANGYTTYAAGKWDQLPQEDTSIAGPFDQWPSGQGFDHFYGFLNAETNNFQPALWEDHAPVEPHVGRADYHLSTDMADKAIYWVTGHASAAPKRPFFLYWATGAVHSPHHAPKAYIEKYRGRFDMGWDKAREVILARQKKKGIVPTHAQLPTRPAELAAWDSLSDADKRMAARQMEVYAAQLEHADHEFGRILDTLQRSGQMENTLVIVTADNGASSEGSPTGTFNDYRAMSRTPTSTEANLTYYDDWGGPKTHPHYNTAWALAVNTPFNYYKQTTRGGGVNVPMVIAWPKAITAKGGTRGQFYYLNDIAPTILDVAGIAPPAEMDGVKQQPLDGVSMAGTFASASAPANKQVQYFEMWGNRAIYAHGWKANATAYRSPWAVKEPVDVANAKWELYDLNRDFNERVDLAEKQPDKLKEMVALFDQEARKYNVYPLRPDFRRVVEVQERVFQDHQGRFVYYPPGGQRIPYHASAPIFGRSFTMTADVEIPATGAEGVIAAQSGLTGGFSLYAAKNKLVFAHNALGGGLFELASETPFAPGHATVKVNYVLNPDTSAAVTLFINDKQVAGGGFAKTQMSTPGMSDIFDVGQDTGSAVSTSYTAPFPFTGTIDKVVVEPGQTPGPQVNLKTK